MERTTNQQSAVDRIFESLREPLRPDEIEWRIKQSPKNEQDPFAYVIPYAKTETIIDRLNKACGSDWSNRYGVVQCQSPDEFVSVECFLTVCGVERSNTGTAAMSKKENAVKGAYSDALKRAAWLFGVGNELRSYPRVMAKCKAWNGSWFVDFDAQKELDGLTTVICNGDRLPNYSAIKVQGYLPSTDKSGNQNTNGNPAAAPKGNVTQTNARPTVEQKANLIPEHKNPVAGSDLQHAKNECEDLNRLKHHLAASEYQPLNITNYAIGELRSLWSKLSQELIPMLIEAIYQGWASEQELGGNVPQQDADTALEQADFQTLKHLYANSLRRQEALSGPAEETFQEKQIKKYIYDGDPIAKSVDEAATPKQIGAMKAIARSKGVDADEKGLELIGCQTHSMSRSAASVFIDYLKNKLQEVPY